MNQGIPPSIQENLAKSKIPQHFSEVVFVSGQINADMSGAQKSAYIKIVFMDGDNGTPQSKIVLPLATATSLMKLIAQHGEELSKKMKLKRIIPIEKKGPKKKEKAARDSARDHERETVDRYVR
jgi:hypothetical protein